MDEEKILEIFKKRIDRINIVAVIMMLIVLPITIFMMVLNLYNIIRYILLIVLPIILFVIIYNSRCPNCGLLAGSFIHFTKRCVNCGAKLLK